MPQLTENPALALRKAVERAGLPGMLRWDVSGAGLLVSDAPRRRGDGEIATLLRGLSYSRLIENDLLFFDFTTQNYTDMLHYTFFQAGQWSRAWCAEQALLSTVLGRELPAAAIATPNIPLLRSALLACAQDEAHFRRFLQKLRAFDAEALRKGNTASVRACAALCARWLWENRGIGLPPYRAVAVDLAGNTDEQPEIYGN